MLNTLEARNHFAVNMIDFLKMKYDLSDTQIFIFGSFLTDDYIYGKSDIDIGVYSEDEIKMYDIKLDLDKYLTELEIGHDIVIMHLSKKLWINIPIMTYGKALTDYDSEAMFSYLVDMINEWGFSPADRIKEAG